MKRLLGSTTIGVNMSVSRRKKQQREEMLRKQSEERKRQKLFAVKKRKVEFVEYVPTQPFIRETPEYPSRTTKGAIYAEKQEAKQYTGDYITGIATMHKSNLVPVGRDDDPEIFAKMRR